MANEIYVGSCTYATMHKDGSGDLCSSPVYSKVVVTDTLTGFVFKIGVCDIHHNDFVQQTRKAILKGKKV